MRLIILGAGGYGQTVADLARQSGKYEAIAFLDDKAEGVLGKCGEFAAFADGDTEMYPAFGNNSGRLNWLDKLEAEEVPIPTIIHATAYVSPTSNIQKGCVVLPGAIVKAENRIPKCMKIEAGQVVENRTYPL